MLLFPVWNLPAASKTPPARPIWSSRPVPEELESKIEIFTLLDKICRPGTILASHLSALSITEISRVTYRARNCVGMRFAEPVDSESKLEIIRGLETDDATLATA